MEIVAPNFERGLRTPAVYKITFNDKWFYVGSSRRIKSRINRWKCCFRGTVYLKSINMRAILPNTNKIEFSIIKWVVDANKLIDEETKYIKESWHNELLLNRCPDAKGNKGMRHYIGYVNKPKYVKSTNLINLERNKKKPIAIFSNSGDLIDTVNSVSELERKYKMRHDVVKKILEGRRGQNKNFKIKKINDDGSIIEPIKFVPKKKGHDQSRKMKPIIKMDMGGEVICRYINVRVAAVDVGCTFENIHRCLKGRFKTAKGFIWKYA